MAAQAEGLRTDAKNMPKSCFMLTSSFTINVKILGCRKVKSYTIRVHKKKHILHECFRYLLLHKKLPPTLVAY